MNVLRMIKLFGWERRVQETVGEKREGELVWIWKRKILGLTNNCVKYVGSCHLFADAQYRPSHCIPLVHMVVTFAVYVSI